MSWSWIEVVTLAAKAARGAGAPAAQAAVFGRATACHLTNGRDWHDLARALSVLPEGPVIAIPLAMAKVLETVDNGQAHGRVDLPEWRALVQSYLAGLPFETIVMQDDDGVDLSVNLRKRGARGAAARIDLPPELAQQMADLAARILVPESDASRLGGAGAGLTDND